MKHIVTLDTDTLYLKSGGVTFKIINDDYGIKEIIGKLKVSNTSIEWFPKHRKGDGIRIKWKTFCKMMEEYEKQTCGDDRDTTSID